MKRIQKPKPQPRRPLSDPEPLVTKLDLLTVLGLPRQKSSQAR
ncbi:MAG: hypothetical protein ACRD0K_26305 [Egibacteraceae bacterium]